MSYASSVVPGRTWPRKRSWTRPRWRSTRSREADQYLVANLLDEYLDGHIKRNRKLKGYTETARLLSHLYTAPIRGLPPAAVKRVHEFELVETLAERAPVLANNADLSNYSDEITVCGKVLAWWALRKG